MFRHNRKHWGQPLCLWKLVDKASVLTIHPSEALFEVSLIFMGASRDLQNDDYPIAHSSNILFVGSSFFLLSFIAHLLPCCPGSFPKPMTYPPMIYFSIVQTDYDMLYSLCLLDILFRYFPYTNITFSFSILLFCLG